MSKAKLLNSLRGLHVRSFDGRILDTVSNVSARTESVRLGDGKWVSLSEFMLTYSVPEEVFDV